MMPAEPLAPADAPKGPESRRKPTGVRVAARASRIWDWLSLRREIALARARPPATRAEQEALTRAVEAVHLGDRLLDPPDGSRANAELAMAPYRDAAYWLLFVAEPELRDEGSAASQLAHAAERASPAFGGWLSAHPLPAALLQSRRELADESPHARSDSVRSAQRWLHALRERLLNEYGWLSRLRLRRLTRLGLLLLVACALSTLTVLAISNVTRGPDLAKGKPWRTSSSSHTCEPDKAQCGGTTSRILFHTNEEANPWFEVDLLAPRRLGRVEVHNRSDSNQDRAVPLLLELSQDGKNYWRVAQRTDPFELWKVHFTPQLARYVRLTVQRTSTLHLERVSVRP